MESIHRKVLMSMMLDLQKSTELSPNLICVQCQKEALKYQFLWTINIHTGDCCGPFCCTKCEVDYAHR